MKRDQSGVMLLEAMIAILIFSLGVLGVVAMQAMAVSASRDAKYRADAALLADELLGKMWASDRTGSVLKTAYEGDGMAGATSPTHPVAVDGAAYTTWAARVAATLPGVGDAPPVVLVTEGAVGYASTVQVWVNWRSPNDSTTHVYRIEARII